MITITKRNHSQMCHRARHIFSLFFLTIISFHSVAQKPKPPIMGWSSWNNFHINIDEKLIREQADAMIASGMYDARYRFINIDDGYFGGRDSNGRLLINTQKFPSGMKGLADYIHSKKLKAGIYSEAGKNTCGSIWDKDSLGIGSGLYGHIKEDLALFLKNWNYDFIKVDWCSGEKMNLVKETQYLKILRQARALKKSVIFNICCWKFPGTWAIRKADSWRISGDISATFGSILHIIDLNADLYKYASAGHYNDMDMLQVGRGMNYDEDKSQFSMWCLVNSPLLAGNDLRSMSKQTVEILTNKEVISLNQDKAFRQGFRIFKSDSIEVWKKPLAGNKGKDFAIAILNRQDATSFALTQELIGSTKQSQLRDLWEHLDIGNIGDGKTFLIPKHGIVVLKVTPGLPSIHF